MCEFCRQWHDENTICGSEIKIHKCAKETELTTAQIMKSTNDNKPSDESPMAYKTMDEIIGNIKDTVEIVDIIKPIYNFKANE